MTYSLRRYGTVVIYVVWALCLLDLAFAFACLTREGDRLTRSVEASRRRGGDDIGDGLPGRFVKFEDLSSCPSLSARRYPKDVKDVRPDDIRVVMAIGDSITAGFLARSDEPSWTTLPTLLEYQSDTHHHQREWSWTSLLNWAWRTAARLLYLEDGVASVKKGDGKLYEAGFTNFKEWRGLSYPIGGDEGAITIPNILSRWTNTSGQSFTPSGLIDWQYTLQKDTTRISSSGEEGEEEGLWGLGKKGLNVAVGGATSPSLVSQVRDHLLPRLWRLKPKEEDWKFLNIGIGGNDLCNYCLSPNSSVPLVGSPKAFAKGIEDAVELLREYTPNLIVNIFGMLHVSKLYKLTLKDPYCRGPILPPFPHLPLECNCALLPGPTGDYTRSKMDELADLYDQAVVELIEKWTKEEDPTFGVMWQPGSMVDLESWPIQALSSVDCFHPSEDAHQRVAAGLWNRMTLSQEHKRTPVKWSDDVYIRCLEEDDRMTLGTH